MITILKKDKLSDELVERYNEIIGLKPGTLSKLDLMFIRYWHDDGTINCHTYPVVVDKTNLETLQENVYKIVKLIDKHHRIKHYNESDWSTYDNGPCELKYISNDTINIYTLVAFYLIINDNNYDQTLFNITLDIDNIFNKVEKIEQD